YDWGDSVVAHPVTVLLVPLRVAADLLGTGPDDRRVAVVRDVSLGVLAGDAPGEDLVATFDLAARVATVARTLVWDRALRAAHEQGEDAHEWADAPAETLAMLLGHAWAGPPPAPPPGGRRPGPAAGPAGRPGPRRRPGPRQPAAAATAPAR